MNELIEIKQLRIGNLLSNDGMIVHVTSLSLDIDDEYKDQICFCNIGESSNEKGGWNRSLVDKLSPIPLTPEWLERCGFSEQGDWYLLDEGRGLMYSYNDDGGIYGFYIVTEYANLTEWNPRPVYVHQLQNFYFALTGEELQIKDL